VQTCALPILLGKLDGSHIAESLSLGEQLFVDFEMAGRDVVDQIFAEPLQTLASSGIVALGMQPVVRIDQRVALVQPTVDQQMYTTPAFLGISTALEHDDLTSLIDDAC